MSFPSQNTLKSMSAGAPPQLDPTGGAYSVVCTCSWFQGGRFAAGREWKGGEEGLGRGKMGREGKGGSWGNSALNVVG